MAQKIVRGLFANQVEYGTRIKSICSWITELCTFITQSCRSLTTILLLILNAFAYLGVVLLTVGRSYVGNDFTHSTLLDGACACSYENLPKYRSYRVSNTALWGSLCQD